MRRTIGLATVLAMLVLAGACDSSDEEGRYGTLPSTSPRVSSMSSPTPSPSPSSTLPPAQQEVVDRYLLYVRTLVHLFETTDPTDVDMSRVSTGPQFRRVVEQAVQLKGQRRYARGKVIDVVLPSTVRISGNSASLESCQDANGLHIYQLPTREEIDPSVRLPKRIARATMIREEGNWKVQNIEFIRNC